MRIKKLHLQNFRGFENLEMTFPETSNLVVLIGKNGSGKTTILDALAHHLEQITIWLMSDEDIDFKKTIMPIKNQTIGKNTFKDPFSVDMEFSYDKESVRENVNITGYELLDKKAHEAYKIIEFIKYIRERSIFINDDNILNKIPILIYYGLNKNEKKHDSAIDANLRMFTPLSLSYENAFCANVNNYDDFLEWYKESEDYENRERLEHDNNFRIRELENLRKALSIFTKLISNLDISNLRIRQYKKEGVNVNFERNTVNYYLSLVKDNIELNFSQLSSGEKAIVLLVADIARRLAIANSDDALNGAGIVLIDEIDQHLHPEWQRNILPALAKTFPNVQFIVTTHSPQVLSSIPKEGVFLIKDGKATNENIYTEGRDSSSILREVFDYENKNTEIKDLLGKISEFIAAYDTDNAQKTLDELAEKWGQQDMEVQRLQSYIDIL